MNRTVLIIIVLLVMAIWFSAIANACAPSTASGGAGWNPPIIIGGGWNQGGWNRDSGSSSSSSPSLPSPSRSTGGSVRGGGISGGSGGK